MADDESVSKEKYERHHIWCNNGVGPVKDCKQCHRLYEKYPMDGLSPKDVARKYFPDVEFRERD